jgi:hypothetical protein
VREFLLPAVNLPLYRRAWDRLHGGLWAHFHRHHHFRQPIDSTTLKRAR